MKIKHIQRIFLKTLFLKCRNNNISPEEATQLFIDEINNNYQLKQKEFEDKRDEAMGEIAHDMP